MRIIVMDEDMREPLTVVEIPIHYIREIESGARYPIIRLPVPMSMASWMTMLDKIPNVPEQVSIRIVDLRLEPIRKRDGILFWVGVPDNPELALLLRAAFLPGQMTELQRREAMAWFQGVMAAL